MVKNEKIEDLNLIALRNYACPKVSHSNEWYLKCLDCRQLADCRVGKRAAGILENMTVSSEKKELTKQLDIFEASANMTKFTKKYVEALRTDDPIGYLVENGYVKNKWRARYYLTKWLSDHPEIKVDIPYNSINGEKISCASNGKRQSKLRLEKLFEVFGDAATPEEMRDRYKAEFGTLPGFGVVYRWVKKYPDLAKKYPLNAFARLLNKKYLAKKEELVENDPVEEDDEISVDDFLKEASAESVAYQETADDVLKKEFERKRDEMLKRKTDINKQIEELNVEKKTIDDQLKLLVESAKLFGADLGL